MKIFQVLNSLECGGLEKLTLDLSLKLTARGHTVTICCLESTGNLLNSSHAELEVISFNKRSELDMTLPFRLAGVISKRKPDIVHTHNPGPLLYGTIAAKLVGVPAVINTRHGRAPKHTNRFVWGMNDAIVSISNDAKNELLKNNIIDQRKVSVIYNGIDLDIFKSRISQNDVKSSLGLDSSFVIGTVSRLSSEKDQVGLIKAFAMIVSAEPASRLVFAGDGPLKNELEGLTDNLGVKDKVSFLGFRDNVSDIMQAFDVFVLSSLQEGISLSLLEAMALGRPTVVTNVGGNPEVVVDGITGLVCPPEDPEALASAITKIMKDRDAAGGMGESGRKRVEAQFDIDMMVDRYLALYQHILNRKTGKS
jgi:sugar transferase (PEP-CTERM/EpsH1 system associated)